MSKAFLEAFKALDEISIQHKVELRPNEAVQIQDIAEIIKEINSIIPVMSFPPPNPNNGQTHHTFEIGREYSRVLYVNVVKGYMPKGYDYKNLAFELGNIATKFHADEMDIVEETSTFFQFRIWWD